MHATVRASTLDRRNAKNFDTGCLEKLTANHLHALESFKVDCSYDRSAVAAGSLQESVRKQLGLASSIEVRTVNPLRIKHRSVSNNDVVYLDAVDAVATVWFHVIVDETRYFSCVCLHNTLKKEDHAIMSREAKEPSLVPSSLIRESLVYYKTDNVFLSLLPPTCRI